MPKELTYLCLVILLLQCSLIDALIRSSAMASSSRPLAGKKNPDLGQRIVDAEEVDPTTRAPFLAVFNFLPVKFAQCTGSVISDYWIISAAHCLGPKEKITLDDCGTKIKPPLNLQCSKTENGDLKITSDPSVGSPSVYVGVRNLIKSIKSMAPLPVEYIIRNKYAYPGGSYGEYGGYDLVLIKLKEPVSSKGPELEPISLPEDENFDDLGSAFIAGYGRSRRAPCEVGRQGPEKFDFCGVEKSCTKASEKFNNAQCSTEFSYKDRVVKGCSYEPTPSSSNKACQNFMKSEKFRFTKDVDEVVILRKTAAGKAKVESRCYRTTPGSYGWCGTIRDYNSFPDGDVQVETDSGWGFCERACYPDTDVSLGGIARKKKVEVISEDYCEGTLKAASEKYEVKPVIMCVAFNYTYRSLFYESSDAGFTKLENISLDSVNKQLNRTVNFYVTGTGTCGGDSGGPLFREQYNANANKKEFVLIGTTSRGTGIRGNCGGLDNPTHYVRIKKFLNWIKSIVGVENLRFAPPGTPVDDP